VAIDTPPTGAFARIRKLNHTLSKGQKKVTDLILRYGVDATYLSSTQIAALAGVDRSTVVRTAQALGYSGFSEFQADLRNQVILHTPMSDRIHSSSRQLAEDLNRQMQVHGSRSILAQVVRSQFENLGDLLGQISDSQLETAAEMIDQAEEVYILADLNSVSAALMLERLIGLIRDNIVLMSSNAINLARQLNELTAEDVLFVFSFNPTALQTLHCMSYARSVGVPMILLTDTPISSAVIHADLVLVAPYRPWSIGYSLAPMAVLNALFGALTLRRGAELQARLERLGKLDQLLGAFESGEE